MLKPSLEKCGEGIELVSAGELRKRLADGANEQPEGGWVIQKCAAAGERLGKTWRPRSTKDDQS